MQNLPVPTLTHGSMFYLHQLWVYNFGVHVRTTGSATMYIWNESIAGRGADEICSCLRLFYSCFGQNKIFRLFVSGISLHWKDLIRSIRSSLLEGIHIFLTTEIFHILKNERHFPMSSFLRTGKRSSMRLA